MALQHLLTETRADLTDGLISFGFCVVTRQEEGAVDICAFTLPVVSSNDNEIQRVTNPSEIILFHLSIGGKHNHRTGNAVIPSTNSHFSGWARNSLRRSQASSPLVPRNRPSRSHRGRSGSLPRPPRLTTLRTQTQDELLESALAGVSFVLIEASAIEAEKAVSPAELTFLTQRFSPPHSNKEGQNQKGTHGRRCLRLSHPYVSAD